MVLKYQMKSQTCHEICIGQKHHRTSSCFWIFQTVCPPISMVDSLYYYFAYTLCLQSAGSIDTYLRAFVTEIKNN